MQSRKTINSYQGLEATSNIIYLSGGIEDLNFDRNTSYWCLCLILGAPVWNKTPPSLYRLFCRLRIRE